MTLAVPPLPASLPLTLPEHRGCYYGGAWHAPRSGREADTINPGTGESLGAVADAGAADVDAAVAAAKAAFRPGATCCRSSAPRCCGGSPRCCASTRRSWR